MKNGKKNGTYQFQTNPIVVICSCCCGIFDLICESFVEELLLQKTARGHQNAPSINLTIRIPASTYIRSHQWWYFLRDRFPHCSSLIQCPTRIASVKDVFKKKLCNLFERRGVLVSPLSKLEMHIHILHQETDLEFLKLYPDLDTSNLQLELSNDEKKKLIGVEDNEQYTKLSIRNVVKANRFNANLDSYRQVVGRIKRLGSDRFINYVNKGDILHECDIVSTEPTYNISFNQESIYLVGRYIKFNRNISQSRIEDANDYVKTSVEELIGPIILSQLQGKKYIFSGAGREDNDVRMLGRGRPFVIEIINPVVSNVSAQFCAALQSKINEFASNMIWVNDLQESKDSAKDLIKEGEQYKKKSYKALVYCNPHLDPFILEKVNTLKDITISQKTPIRVLHKRSLSVRDKMIHHMHCSYFDKNHIILDIETQAGTYIKEFVNGDLGRTLPNLHLLLGIEEAVIIRLDVVDIESEWPSAITGRDTPPLPISLIDEQ